MERISCIDVAKGIMITLVVLGHCSATSLGDHSRLFYFIYAFHMPCWFFLSGLLYKSKAHQAFFNSKLKNLLLPYLLYSIINAFSYMAFLKMGMIDYHPFVSFGGLWFLITLFFIDIVYYVVDNVILANYSIHQKNVITGILSIVCLLAGMTLGRRYFPDHNTLSTTLVGFFFYHVGRSIQPLSTRMVQSGFVFRVTMIVSGLFILAILAYSAPINPIPVDMNIGRFGNSALFIIQALLGIVGMLFLCMGILHNKIMEYFGRNSLLILVLHIPLWRTFDYFVSSYGGQFTSNGNFCSLIHMLSRPSIFHQPLCPSVERAV